MKITKESLKQIIKEELEAVMDEATGKQAMAIVNDEKMMFTGIGDEKKGFEYVFPPNFKPEIKDMIISYASKNKGLPLDDLRVIRVKGVPNLAKFLATQVEGVSADVIAAAVLKIA